MDEGLSVTGRRMVGYALHWRSPAFIREGGHPYAECFERGAFAKSIVAGRVLLCSDHDRSQIVARQDDGTLTLVEDAVGLRIDAWANNSLAGDVAIHDARCRWRAGLSVGFTALKEEWLLTETGKLRVVTEADLVEISIIRTPAYRSSELYAGKMRVEAFEARLP
jgi:HK97 family phage prohead protease